MTQYFISDALSGDVSDPIYYLKDSRKGDPTAWELLSSMFIGPPQPNPKYLHIHAHKKKVVKVLFESIEELREYFKK